jgi:sulfur carrier protein ThiS adenylyltransferase
MQIKINEKPVEVPAGTTLLQVRDRFRPDADVLIYNGFPLRDDCPLREGDRVVLIRRGEQPAREEMEALLVSRHTPGVHERVRGACVGIAGAGGLGSAIAVALARIGIGALIVADFDVVEPSNLNRQQYFVDQIGLAKVDALQQNLARINPYVRVTTCNERLTPDNIPAVFAGVDVMVEAFDAADQKAMLAATFLGACPGIPFVAASGLAGYGPSGSIRTRRVATNFYLVGDGETAARPGEGLMAPRVGVAAHHQANAVLRLLLGEEPA